MLTLFEYCLKMVARNICYVESFVGFPDLIGKQIFHAAEKERKFDLQTPAQSLCALSLFTNAFADHILSDVNIEGKHLALANCVEHFILFNHLRALNISSCCLGDNHELLFHISTLRSLQVLLLKNNALSDEGIRKFTAPMRVKKTGPLNLQILDLSENEAVSIRALKFLHIFGKLQLLNLSSTDIKDSHMPELHGYATRRSLTINTAMTEQQAAKIQQLLEVETKGWAVQTITNWIQLSQQPRLSAQRILSSQSAVQRFYGRTKKDLQKKFPIVSSSNAEQTRKPHLTLILVSDSIIPRTKTMREDSIPAAYQCTTSSSKKNRAQFHEVNQFTIESSKSLHSFVK